MSSRLPLFPLTTALVPGLVLPLHIFEPRYCELVETLLAIDDADEREFGIVAVRDGQNADESGLAALYPIGTAVVLRQVESRDDGRFDIVTTGSRRFRLLAIDTSAPLMQADVEFIDDTEDVGDPALSVLVAQRFEQYRGALSGQVPSDPEADASGEADEAEEADELPTDPTVLSFLVTAAMVLPTDERQQLLSAPTTDERLTLAASLLARETALVRSLGAVPAIDPVFTTASAN